MRRGTCGLERDTDALIWKLGVSLFCWAFLTRFRAVPVEFSGATAWSQVRCCVLWLPRSLGCSTRIQQVRNLCIIKHIHVRARKQPWDLKRIRALTALFLYLLFQSWLTQLISFFSSSSFFFRSPTAIFFFPGKWMCWKTALLHTDTFFSLYPPNHDTLWMIYVALPLKQSFPFMALKGWNQVTGWES